MKANLTRGNSVTENHEPYSNIFEAIAFAMGVVQETVRIAKAKEKEKKPKK
jgi:hypothetical protein